MKKRRSTGRPTELQRQGEVKPDDEEERRRRGEKTTRKGRAAKKRKRESNGRKDETKGDEETYDFELGLRVDSHRRWRFHRKIGLGRASHFNRSSRDFFNFRVQV